MRNKKAPTPRRLSKKELQAEAITLFLAGLTIREIAKRLGSSPATICRITRSINSPQSSRPTTTPTTTQPTTTQPTPAKPTPAKPTPKPSRQPPSPTTANAIIKKANSAINNLIEQIELVTEGETDVAKLATAADKLSIIAERIANLERLAMQTDENNSKTAFLNEFTGRHLNAHKN